MSMFLHIKEEDYLVHTFKNVELIEIQSTN